MGQHQPTPNQNRCGQRIEEPYCSLGMLQAAANNPSAAPECVCTRTALCCVFLCPCEARLYFFLSPPPAPLNQKKGLRQTTDETDCSETHKSTDHGCTTATTKAIGLRDSANTEHGNDLVLGECSLNLVEVVSGRAPHIDEWIPLDSGGDLRLSLDFDSVGRMPAPGDSVREESRRENPACFVIVFSCVLLSMVVAVVVLLLVLLLMLLVLPPLLLMVVVI